MNTAHGLQVSHEAVIVYALLEWNMDTLNREFCIKPPCPTLRRLRKKYLFYKATEISIARCSRDSAACEGSHDARHVNNLHHQYGGDIDASVSTIDFSNFVKLLIVIGANL